MILYVSPDKMLPVQLTLVNYRKAAQLPAIYFEGWLKLSKEEQQNILPILTSLPVAAFLRFDPPIRIFYLGRNTNCTRGEI